MFKRFKTDSSAPTASLPREDEESTRGTFSISRDMNKERTMINDEITENLTDEQKAEVERAVQETLEKLDVVHSAHDSTTTTEVVDSENVQSTQSLESYYVEGEKWMGESKVRVNGTILYPSSVKEVTIKNESAPLVVYAAPMTRENNVLVEMLPTKSTIAVVGWVFGGVDENNNDKWWITEDHQHVSSSDTYEKPS